MRKKIKVIGKQSKLEGRRQKGGVGKECRSRGRPYQEKKKKTRKVEEGGKGAGGGRGGGRKEKGKGKFFFVCVIDI